MEWKGVITEKEAVLIQTPTTYNVHIVIINRMHESKDKHIPSKHPENQPSITESKRRNVIIITAYNLKKQIIIHIIMIKTICQIYHKWLQHYHSYWFLIFDVYNGVDIKLNGLEP